MFHRNFAAIAPVTWLLLSSCSLIIDTNPDGVIYSGGAAGRSGGGGGGGGTQNSGGSQSNAGVPGGGAAIGTGGLSSVVYPAAAPLRVWLARV